MFIKLTKYIILIDRQDLIFLWKLKGGEGVDSMDILILSIYIGWSGNVIGQTCPITEIGNSLIFNIIGYIMVNYEER